MAGVTVAPLALGLLHLALAQVPCTLEPPPCPAPVAREAKAPPPAPAATPWTALQLSLFAPVQLFSVQREVRGLRLNLGRADNVAAFGLDVGLGNQSERAAGVAVGVLWNFTEGDFTGLQVGAVNFSNSAVAITRGVRVGLINSDGGLDGLSVGLLNLNLSILGNPFLRGAQLGVVNGTDNAVGLQAGAWSSASTLWGAQLGVVNQTEDLLGVQLGVLNLGRDCVGMQVGVVNRCHTLRGVQLGLVNLIRDGAVPFLPVVNAGR